MVPELGHTEGEVVVENNVIPNCTNNGSYENVVYCTVCGEELSREEIIVDALGHIEVVDKAVAPTCTETGLTEGKHCSRCSAVLVAQEVVPALGHTESEWIVDLEPTITEDGKYHTICVSCGIMMSEDVLYATGSIGLEFELNSDGESYSVIGVGTCKDTDIVIPNMYNRLPVTIIGNDAFYDCSSLANITIPYSVTSIGWGAFWDCISLTSVTIGNSVISIGGYAFSGCTSLTSITIPDSVTSIGGEAFYGCSSLISVTLPNFITSIEWGTFMGCSKLVSIIIPDSVTNIDEGAFINCTSLTSVTIGESVTSIATDAFGLCWSIVEICNKSSLNFVAGSWENGELAANALHIITDESESNLRYVGDYVFYDDGTCVYFIKYIGNETEITLPEYENGKEYEVWDYAFNHSSEITSVTLGDSVTRLRNNAFYCCENLTYISISDSISYWHTNALNYCNSLKYNEYSNAVYLGNENNPYLILIEAKDKDITTCEIYSETKFISSYAFEACKLLTSIVIPDSVTSIGYRAFYDCHDLANITIGKSVKSIDDSAFGRIFADSYVYYHGDIEGWLSISFEGYDATPVDATSILYLNGERITNVVIPDSITSIGDFTFSGWHWLTSVTIPDSVTSIGDYAFYRCDSLTSITIPNSVTSIGMYAFYNCTSLTSITIPDSVTNIGSRAFASCYSIEDVYYEGDIEGWLNFSFSYEESNPCYGSADLYFAGERVTVVTIPNSVTNIGNYAFYGCTSLTSITIPDSVTSIGSKAFYYCHSLTSITIPDSVTSIDGEFPFFNCWGLTSIEVGENNECFKSIDGNLYTKDGAKLIQYAVAKKDTSFTIPDSVMSIASRAFQNCHSLISVTIPDSVMSIGSMAFANCTSLTSVTIPDSLTSIGNLTFENCYSLTSITIPDSVTSIGYGAFRECRSLTSVTIPDSLTSIGDNAFDGCYSLTSITISDNVTTIGKYAFYNCKNLTDITFNGTVAQWNAITFGNHWDNNVPATKVVCTDGTVYI